jgi:hypothetical protein
MLSAVVGEESGGERAISSAKKSAGGEHFSRI